MPALLDSPSFRRGAGAYRLPCDPRALQKRPAQVSRRLRKRVLQTRRIEEQRRDGLVGLSEQRKRIHRDDVEPLGIMLPCIEDGVEHIFGGLTEGCQFGEANLPPVALDGVEDAAHRTHGPGVLAVRRQGCQRRRYGLDHA